jgi:hypothetical protein
MKLSWLKETKKTMKIIPPPPPFNKRGDGGIFRAKAQNGFLV